MSWLEIKKSINSDLDTPLNVTLGKKTDTAGTSTSSSLFSWVKQIFTNLSTVNSSVSTINSRTSTIDTNTARGAVKSVQRGVSTTGSVTLSSINAAKSFVILNWQYETTGGTTATYSTYEVPYLISLTSTALTFGKNLLMSSNGNTQFSGAVSWQVIEYY